MAPGAAAVPAALSTQVEGVEVPEERRHQGVLGGTSLGSVELHISLKTENTEQTVHPGPVPEDP